MSFYLLLFIYEYVTFVILFVVVCIFLFFFLHWWCVHDAIPCVVKVDGCKVVCYAMYAVIIYL